MVSSLAADMDAALFIVLHIVLHIPPNQVSRLPPILSNKGSLPAKHPVDGEEILAGRIYVAPPGDHLLVQDGRVVVTRGPKKNPRRPSIDALFRSAAYCYREQAIGIVLSGALNDGTLGLWSIKRMGGMPITQSARKPLLTRFHQAHWRKCRSIIASQHWKQARCWKD